MKISLDNIDVFVFDFDGVLTNNLVQLDENGKESVSCSRADGYIGCYVMEKKTMFQIDEKNDVEICESIMRKINQ